MGFIWRRGRQWQLISEFRRFVGRAHRAINIISIDPIRWVINSCLVTRRVHPSARRDVIRTRRDVIVIVTVAGTRFTGASSLILSGSVMTLTSPRFSRRVAAAACYRRRRHRRRGTRQIPEQRGDLIIAGHVTRPRFARGWLQIGRGCHLRSESYLRLRM